MMARVPAKTCAAAKKARPCDHVPSQSISTIPSPRTGGLREHPEAAIQFEPSIPLGFEKAEYSRLNLNAANGFLGAQSWLEYWHFERRRRRR